MLNSILRNRISCFFVVVEEIFWQGGVILWPGAASFGGAHSIQIHIWPITFSMREYEVTASRMVWRGRTNALYYGVAVQQRARPN